MKRIVCILLIICMIALTLSSCAGGNPVETNSPTGDNTSTDAQGTSSKWDDVNFNGESIIVNISNLTYSAALSAGAENAVKYIIGPDSYTTDPVQNAVYDRNKNVTEKLGLEITYQLCEQYDGNDPNKALTVIETFVLADLEDTPDIVGATSYGIVRAGIKGHLHNALSTDKENYFEITEETGWYPDFMYENTLDNSKLYLLAGDYFIDVLRFAYATFVNLDMYDEVFASEGGSESLFELIESGNWNYDEFKRCVNMAYVDGGEIGALDDADTFGAINAPHWLARCAFANSGLDIFETTEDGKLRYVEDITDVHNFIDDLLALGNTSGFYLNLPSYMGAVMPQLNEIEVFMDGRALFCTDAYVLSLEGTALQNMDDKAAIIPFPKYNSDNNYSALVSDCATVGGVLYNSDKFTECSAFLQMATEESNGDAGTLLYEYYEIALKYKLSSTPQQVTMLEYIRNGLTCPKSVLLDNYFAKNVGLDTFANQMTKALIAGVNSIASSWDSQYSAVQGSLESTVANYGN